MTTVFLSGSRGISRLNDKIRQRVKNITDKGFLIILGDANGADKALQKLLADVQYTNVVVFCSGHSCRNNVGNWKVRQIAVDPEVTGRAFYAQKDRAMAAEADYGLILWDGKSAGSISNALELLKREKPVVVYFSPEKDFYQLSHLDDIQELLNKCDGEALRAISRKVDLKVARKGVEHLHQGRLNF